MSGTESQPEEKVKYKLAESHDLSARSKWLRNYYFKGLEREWINEYSPFTTGLDGDRLWAETDFYIVPELYFYMGAKDWGVFGRSVALMGQKTNLPQDFWEKSL
ncbi:MAG: hypothetical protein ACTSP4_06030, partial [Candidatus Hodarchaeales archaeon]